MGRLTKRIPGGIERECKYVYKDMCYGCEKRAKCNADIMERLAAYEDTGLEPEEIQEAVNLFKDWRDADIPKELKSWVERCTWHVRKCEELRRELNEYKDAEEQGRLIVLPCKVGDKVYDISEFMEGCLYPEMYEYTADYIGIGKSEDGRTVITIDCMDYYTDDFGKTVFLTREEAGRALEGLT